MTSACSPHPFHCVYSLSGSDALNTAFSLFHQQLRVSIGQGEVESYHITAYFSALSGLDPFQTGNHVYYGFLWIADLLNSRYTNDERYSMAGQIIQLLGKHIHHIASWQVGSGWVSSLVSFLSLGEQFYSTWPTPRPGVLALKILSSAMGNFDPTPTILPVLASTLIPTHPLKSRILALDVFRRFMGRWSSSQMENVPNNHLDELLRAVGDPFEYPDLPLQNGQPVAVANYSPMEVVVILIGFASSDLWRNHLRRSNFASCEEILSTDEGRRDALRSVFDTANFERPDFLRTPVEIIAAISRLEELQCPNTAGVVILWAWTVGVVNVAGYDAWGSIERNTLNFYQSHGISRLASLSRHLTDTATEGPHLLFLLMHYQGPLCRVGCMQRLVSRWEAQERWNTQHFEVLRVAQACQLRRLYQLFGYDPTTWKEAVTVEDVDENSDVFSGRSVTFTQFPDWVCDYP